MTVRRIPLDRVECHLWLSLGSRSCTRLKQRHRPLPAPQHESTFMPDNARKIFVVYPRGLRTGGPEALHQLVDMLRSLGQDAYLVPHWTTKNEDRAAQFAGYDAPEATEIDDSTGNLVVVPEVFVADLFALKQATPVCWWLSIDNSPTFMAERIVDRSLHNKLQSYRAAVIPYLQLIKNGVGPGRIKRSRIVHLAQSSYAWSFLFARLNVVPSLLSDYTPTQEFEAADHISRNSRLVTFNPVKGGNIIREVMKIADPAIQWRPIQGMTRPEVVATLQECAIYLDLGFHPGKDRMPREAALSGALTVVGRRGSGAFFADVPLPWEHKINPDDSEVQTAAAMLPKLMDDLNSEISKQDSYRNTIRNEKAKFESEVSDIFLRQRFGNDAYDYLDA